MVEQWTEYSDIFLFVDIYLSIEIFFSKHCYVSSEIIFLSDCLVLPLQYLYAVFCFSQGSWLQATVINGAIEAENKGLKLYFKVHKLERKARDRGLHNG